MLDGLDLWILDALRYTPHPRHFSVARRSPGSSASSRGAAILTHMHTDLDYDDAARELPAHVEPAYDGMIIETSAELTADLRTG